MSMCIMGCIGRYERAAGTHRRTAVIGGQQSSGGMCVDSSPSYSHGLPLYMAYPYHKFALFF